MVGVVTLLLCYMVGESHLATLLYCRGSHLATLLYGIGGSHLATLLYGILGPPAECKKLIYTSSKL